jgi:hypothetical protein
MAERQSHKTSKPKRLPGSLEGVYPEAIDPSTQFRVDAEQRRSIEGLAMTKRGFRHSLWRGRRCFVEKVDVLPFRAGTFPEQR